MIQQLSVENYRPSSDPVEKSLAYPGSRPDGSFITDGTTVTLLPDSLEEFRYEADKTLEELGLPGIDERTPAISYGANASPTRLAVKMKAGDPVVERELQVVPHLQATMPGQLAVWHGRLGQNGSIFAELYHSDNPRDSLTAHVAFLTDEQLALMHVSEGVTYTAAELRATVNENDKKSETLTVLGYVAIDSSLLLHEGKPVLVANARNNAEGLAAMTASEAIDYMLTSVSHELGALTCRDLIAGWKSLNLSTRKGLQAQFGDLLTAAGIRREYKFPLAAGMAIGRTDFNELPGHRVGGLLQIPESRFARLRPSDETVTTMVDKLMARNPNLDYQGALAKIRETKDPAHKLSRRAHDELAIRLKKA